MTPIEYPLRRLLVAALLCASWSAPGCANDDPSTASGQTAAAEEPAVSTSAVTKESAGSDGSNAAGQTEAVDDGNTAAAAEPDPFAVPEGSVAELFSFISAIKQLQPTERTQEAITAHLEKQVAAVMTATDRILAQEVDDKDALRAVEEKFRGLSLLARIDQQAQDRLLTLARSLQHDSRPDIVRAADFQVLRLGVFETLQRREGREAVVNDVFAFIDKYGLDSQGVSFASQLGQVLSESEPEIANQLLSRLASMLQQSDNPEFQAQAEEVEAVLRRLNLPGQFMELYGVTADGNPFDWESYRGNYVLVDFWATWCGPCRAELPNVKKNLTRYGDKGFRVVGVNLDQDRADFDAFMADAQLPWQNIMPDEEGNSELASYYAITGIPTVILVDREGKVISMNARGPELGRLLETHLGAVDDTADDE